MKNVGGIDFHQINTTFTKHPFKFSGFNQVAHCKLLYEQFVFTQHNRIHLFGTTALPYLELNHFLDSEWREDRLVEVALKGTLSV